MLGHRVDLVTVSRHFLKEYGTSQIMNNEHKSSNEPPYERVYFEIWVFFSLRVLVKVPVEHDSVVEHEMVDVSNEIVLFL